jgi:hypothetical protein
VTCAVAVGALGQEGGGGVGGGGGGEGGAAPVLYEGEPPAEAVVVPTPEAELRTLFILIGHLAISI